MWKLQPPLMLWRVVFPKIGKLPIKQITSAFILDVLQSAAKKNGLTAAGGEYARPV